MKRIFGLLIALVMVLGFSVQTQATLILRGTDTLGNRLIYDDDLDITWYDYTKAINTWQNQVNWADGLSVDFGGTIYDDWRLPKTVDGKNTWRYDGSTSHSYNNTTSEMGHLFYTELGNLGYCKSSGSCLNTGWGLTKTGDFKNLKAHGYWSGTEYALNPVNAWTFSFYGGIQDLNPKNQSNYALAVRPGDVVAAVPGPGTLLLLGSGLAGLVLTRKRLG